MLQLFSEAEKEQTRQQSHLQAGERGKGKTIEFFFGDISCRPIYYI